MPGPRCRAGLPPGLTLAGQRTAFSQPDLLTGVNPATGQPQLHGSVGVDINCAVIGFTAKAPAVNLAPNLPGSQFPPR